MTPKQRNATIGLTVAVGVTMYIIVRLVQASAPQPTTLQLINASKAPITVTQLKLRGEVVLADAASLEPGASGLSTRKAVGVSPGRIAEVEALIAGRVSPAVCAPDPRPQGVCVVRATYDGSSELRCEHACQDAPPAK